MKSLQVFSFLIAVTLPPLALAEITLQGVPGDVTLDCSAIPSPAEVTAVTDCQGPSSDGLVLHYNFEVDEGGVVSDQSGHGHQGEVLGAQHVGGAMDFEQSDNEYIRTPSTPLLDIVGPLTVATRIKPETSTGVAPSWISKSDNVGNRSQWRLGFGNPGENWWGLTWWNGSTWRDYWVTNNLPLGQWTHVAVVADPGSGTIHLYQDGVEVKKWQGVVVDFQASTGQFYVARQRDNNTYFDGAIDDVLIYGRALSAAEIGALHSQQASTVAVSFAEVRTGQCPQVITRTWSATDACDNHAGATQRIEVVDGTAPVLVGVPPDQTVTCNSIPAPPVVTAMDDCPRSRLSPDDLVLHYDFAEDGATVSDKSAHGHHGQVFGAAYQSEAMDFERDDNDYVRALSSPLLDITGELTLCIRVRPESVVGVAPAWISKVDNTGSHSQWRFGFGNPAEGRWGLTWWNGSTWKDYWVTNQIPVAQWTHLTAVVNPGLGRIELYRDGVEIRTWEGVTVDFQSSTGALYLAHQRDNNSYYDGALDDAVIYARALSSNQVAELAAGALTEAVPVSLVSVETGACPKLITRTWSAEDACGNSTSATQRIAVEEEESSGVRFVSLPGDTSLPSGPGCETELPDLAALAAAESDCCPPAYETPNPTNFTAIRYVSPGGSNQPPYASWDTAAHTIQAAVDVSAPGELVLVAAGTYDTGSRPTPGGTLPARLVVTSAVTVASQSGPALTTIEGQGPIGAGAIRGVYLVAGAELIGFTVEQGHTRAYAGGLPAQDVSGAGVFCSHGGTVRHCVVRRNQCPVEGGGVYILQGPARISDCVIEQNFAFGGGGVRISDAIGAVVERCRIVDNLAGFEAGGVQVYHSGNLNNCLIAGNSASNRAGGIYIDYGTFSPANPVLVQNCTIAYNRAPNHAGISYIVAGATFRNSILYGNTNGNWNGGTYAYCLSDPIPAGTANLGGDPAFVDASGGNFHLSGGSSCIDSGSNAFAPLPADLDGYPRINQGAVDRGCYEAGPRPTCEIEITQLPPPGTLLMCGSYEVVLTARDQCGQSTVATQLLTVVDDEPPVLSGVPDNLTVSCDLPLPIAPNLTATDTCDALPAVVLQEVRQDNCPEIVTRTWTATDACGNSAVATQRITVVDDAPPVLSGIPADVTIGCELPLPAVPSVSAVDGCDLAPGVLFQQLGQDDCPGTVRRVWTATDACGNSIGATQRISIAGVTIPAGDFDGDGEADLAVYLPANGRWFIRNSRDGATRRIPAAGRDAIPAAGDYDGDEVIDPAVYFSSSGGWAYLRSSDGQVVQSETGWIGGIPVIGDYDGDGITDKAVYTRSTGIWQILYSGGGTLSTPWGWFNAIPVPGDYDGDGKTDLAIYDPPSGFWYIRRSLDGSWYSVDWGGPEFLPAPADYTADKQTDVAVYQMSNGMWYIVDPSEPLGHRGLMLGGPNYVPVPDDYDSDLEDDPAVYGTQDGWWGLLQSTEGTTWSNFGRSDARPVHPLYIILRQVGLVP